MKDQINQAERTITITLNDEVYKELARLNSLPDEDRVKLRIYEVSMLLEKAEADVKAYKDELKELRKAK